MATASSGDLLERVDQVLAETYRAGSVLGDGESFSIYPVATGETEGRGIRALVADEKAVRTFEVGFALGLSTLSIAAGLLEVGDPGATHTAIDPTETSVWKS